jgi:plasmid stability protein
MVSMGRKGMAQLLVRNLENSVKARLQRRARRHGRSMEEEVRDILRAAVHKDEDEPVGGFGTEMSKLFSRIGLESPIPEIRGYEIKPPKFDE